MISSPRPSGTGYPFRRSGQELDLQTRIVAVADSFQALAQDRPYRCLSRFHIDSSSRQLGNLSLVT